MKKAFVTGGAGFIGSQLAEELIKLDYEVHIIDNLSSGYRKFIPDGALFHHLDICSADAKDAIVREKPDVVFHLAAQADVTRSISNPQYDAEINIIGTINMLEACREAGCSKFIFSSTSAVYGNLNKSNISIEDPALPISYYGLSKFAAENYIRIYHELYNLPITILRYGNVYGPRQTPKGEGGVVAVFLNRLKNKQALTLHGDGRQTRDFIYVGDVVKANLAAIYNGNGQTLHVSTGKPTSIQEVADILKELHQADIDVIYSNSRPGDIEHSCLNNEHTIHVLEWLPEMDMKSGLKAAYIAIKNDLS